MSIDLFYVPIQPWLPGGISIVVCLVLSDILSNDDDDEMLKQCCNSSLASIISVSSQNRERSAYAVFL